MAPACRAPECGRRDCTHGYAGKGARRKKIYSYDGTSDQLFKTSNGNTAPDGVQGWAEQELNPSQCDH